MTTNGVVIAGFFCYPNFLLSRNETQKCFLVSFCCEGTKYNNIFLNVK